MNEENDGVSIHSGFPNPAADKKRLGLDLNQLIIKHPSSTYLFRIAGHNWNDQGIYDGDIAVVDRALNPRPADLVVVWHNNSFTLVRPLDLHKESSWGVVSTVIHSFRRKL